MRGTQRHLAAISGSNQPVYVFFYQKDIYIFKVLFIILNSINFQAIQTAVSYQKNMYKKLRPNFLMFKKKIRFKV